jgi:hypothetical protein
MNTAFLLAARYDGLAVIPLEKVQRDFFPHLTVDKLAHKLGRGEIALPMVRIEKSQKASRGVHLSDLANWIDARREAAQKELKSILA